jgi:DNA-directed RNA polymerase subunit RPC12/RpoP
VSAERDQGVECPFCGSFATEFMAMFGQQLLTVQYYCNTCQTPFERVKGPDILADAARHAADSGGRPAG